MESDALWAENAPACFQRLTDFLRNQVNASQVIMGTESKGKVAQMRAYLNDLAAGSHTVVEMLVPLESKGVALREFIFGYNIDEMTQMIVFCTEKFDLSFDVFVHTSFEFLDMDWIQIFLRVCSFCFSDRTTRYTV